MKKILGSVFGLVLCLLLLILLSFATNWYFSIGHKINDVGDGLCDICGAPATYEHIRVSGRRETLVGEYCDSHSFPHGEFYESFIAAPIMIGWVFSGIVFFISFCPSELPTSRLRILLTSIAGTLLIVWFIFQFNQIIQLPNFWLALGFNIFWLVVYLGIMVYELFIRK